ncbi:MAG: Tim44 domain-containing protein [Magnetococcales bacterium]|nr:Tim44 domain-containing protein [Magnetococcales bacterium]MBF0151811.1 Tim44 domain-containing protein [Magnetococcales bacterium]MBF0174578.1 Tim44 domain-containing protein [Magnetococcales bacterium]MBF0630367.1 Tim44 domain-containing protein [Magnetococcales bacterium]
MKRSNVAIIFMAMIFGAFVVFSETADAKRMGGGSSFGSRGSKSYSAPQQAAPRSGLSQSSSTPYSSTRPGAAAAGGMFGGMGSGLLGGLGGFMLGGFLGSMLFGGMGSGMGAGGGGFGLLELILIGGLLWFGFRWFKRQRAMAPAGGPSSPGLGGFNGAAGRVSDMMNHSREGVGHGLPQSFKIGASESESGVDEVSQGVGHIASMDPTFNEGHFLEGARVAFQQLQKSWCDGHIENLRPLLTPAMMERIQADLRARQEANLNDVIENIQFRKAEISEAWQESGEDWITVHFQVVMLEYATDGRGVVVEGDRSTPVNVEEFWTFTRPVGSKNPNWSLAAIQQPGQALN